MENKITIKIIKDRLVIYHGDPPHLVPSLNLSFEESEELAHSMLIEMDMWASNHPDSPV